MLDVTLLFLTGPPNVGKSTQAQMLADRATIISAGEWLRALRTGSDADLAQFVTHNWTHDSLSPLVSEYLDGVVADACERSVRDSCALLLVVDGFPRTVSEVTDIARIARGCPLHVVLLETSAEVIRDRAHARQRLDDDTDYALDIRSESYASKREAIVRELVYQRARYSVLATDATTTPADTHARICSLLAFDRVPIPAIASPATLARRYFHETSAIERARISQCALRVAGSKRFDQSFFGTHPISLTRLDLPRVRRFPYLVSLKAEGVRFMALVAQSRLWLISRKLRVFAGPVAPVLADWNGTLLDGELLGGEEDAATMFLVLDVLSVAGRLCIMEPILRRLERASTFLATTLPTLTGSRLTVRVQEYVDRTQLSALIARGSPWAIDGIIFQPAQLGYRHGIDNNCFKYKPLGENSVDFYYNAADDGLYAKKTSSSSSSSSSRRQGAPANAPEMTVKRHTLARMGTLLPEIISSFAPWVRDGMILECVSCPRAALVLLKTKPPPASIIWFPKLHRGDKPTANLDWVAQSVVQSIIDDISQEELQRECALPTLCNRDLSDEVLARIPTAAAATSSKRNRR